MPGTVTKFLVMGCPEPCYALVRGAPNQFYVLRLFFAKQEKTRSLYVGYTEDLENRLKKHNAGEVQSTRPYRPWTLIYYEAFISKKDAKQREQYLKTTKG